MYSVTQLEAVADRQNILAVQHNCEVQVASLVCGNIALYSVSSIIDGNYDAAFELPKHSLAQ